MMISIDDLHDEDLHSLYAWLAPNAGGRVTLQTRLPGPGELGFAVEAVMVSLAPGGVVAGVVAAVATWLSCRRAGEVTVRITGANGRSVEVTAKQVRGLNPAELHTLVQQLSIAIGTAPAEQTSLPVSSDVDIR